jgi:hypothetical protein
MTWTHRGIALRVTQGFSRIAYIKPTASYDDLEKLHRRDQMTYRIGPASTTGGANRPRRCRKAGAREEKRCPQSTRRFTACGA